jgi:psp operon transcriptional activator
MPLADQTRETEKAIPMPEAIGQSEAFIEFQEQISRVAPIDRPVLILGERGTGKELAAARVHFLSRRWQRPFVTLNCAALTASLIGSELFGYEKGAFTGAGSRQTGRFEAATEGTLFLDEIGMIPMEVQEKILRVVEYGIFERVGASQSIQVDVRIVAATNADLLGMAQAGSFKRDLLDRLSFEVIYAPPLRYRKEDILILANYFAGRMAYELGRDEVPRISRSAVSTLEAYPWPGNIRELKNVIERAVYRSNTRDIREISFDLFCDPYESLTVSKSDAPESVEKKNRAADVPGELNRQIFEMPFKQAVGALERHLLSDALDACRFNQKQAAKKLGLTYDQFRGIMKKHRLFLTSKAP